MYVFLPAFRRDQRVKCYVGRRKITIILIIKEKHAQTHKAITYFCKESFEEFPVLEVDVVKKEGGGDGGEEQGMKMLPRKCKKCLGARGRDLICVYW